MVVLNALHPPFNDARARQALYYLVNQKQMLAAMGYPDKYRVDYCATLYICGSPLATDAGAAPYAKPDPARARQLLQEAGYKGEKVVLLYPTDHLSAPAVMVLSQNLKKAGVNVDLQSMDWASLAARRLKKDPPAQGGWNLFLTWGGYYDASTPVTNPGCRPPAATACRAGPATRSWTNCAPPGSARPTRASARSWRPASRNAPTRPCPT